MTPAKNDTATLVALYAQIEDVYRHFKEIRKEAEGIVETSQMPDAALHLNDVLQHTETATTTILDAATLIGSLTDGSALAVPAKQQIHDQINLIYEACSFQDISGQRIKKVLKHLAHLEGQLQRLSETARTNSGPAKVEDVLLQGPALLQDAPSQADIDAMFKQS